MHKILKTEAILMNNTVTKIMYLHRVIILNEYLIFYKSDWKTYYY